LTIVLNEAGILR